MEKTIEFGQGFVLNGIVTEPENCDPRRSALLILNSGVMHRVGTCRTSVILARQVADDGRIALRFDLSGIGDSNSRSVDQSDDQRIQSEIRCALDYLELNYDVNQFCIYGLCSGAHNAFKTAIVDQRIIGWALIDSFAYPTGRFYLRNYLFRIGNRLVKPKSWWSYISRFLQSKSKRQSKPVELQIWPDFPPKSETEKAYKDMIVRGVMFYLVFTEGWWAHYYNYESQIYDMFPNIEFKNQMKVKVMRFMSHIMSEPDFQKEIRTELRTWIKELPV